MTALRTFGQQVFSYSPNQDDHALQHIGYGTTTGAGSAGGTTLVDADGVANSGTANTYNGRYWVQIISGTLRGRECRVIDDDGSGTLTLYGNGFSAQVGSGVEYRMYKSSEPIVVADSGSTTTAVDADRNEDDGYWNGYYLTGESGSNIGQIKEVTDFVNSTGTFTVGALANAVAAGDVLFVRQFIEAGNVSASPAQAYGQRIAPRQNFSRQDGVVGAKSGTISFDVEAVASGSLAASGSVANKSKLHGLFQACNLVEVIGTSTSIDDAGGSSTTTSLKIDTATHENFQIGQAIMHQGNVTFVTAKTDGGGSADTLTVYPPLPVVPNDNDAIYACRTYKFDTDATSKSVTLYWEVDGVRTTFFNCKGNVELVPGDTGALLFRFSFSYDHWVREIQDEQANPADAYSTAAIVRAFDRLVHWSAVGGGSTEQLDVKSITFSPGVTTTPRDVTGKYGINGVSGFQVNGHSMGGSFQTLIEDSGDSDLKADELFTNRTAKDLAVVFGSHGNCIAVRMPKVRLRELPNPQDDDGKMATVYALEAQDAGTVSDPANGTEKLYDWAVHIF